jgi:Mlc titration factor MtfA (ptsG expression regulator)
VRRRQQRTWLDGWEHVAEHRLRAWPQLDPGERARLGELVEWFVRRKRFEAAHGFALTQDVVVTVAAHAALLVLGLDEHALRDVRSVVVHRGSITQRGVRATGIRGVVADGPRRVLGHTAALRGPVVLSWSTVLADLARPAGHNVVLHELAHKLDAADGLFDGTPDLLDGSLRAEWVRVCTREYRRVRRRGSPVLRDYAGTNPAEFFAVATEAFFERPAALAEAGPALYSVLRRYYGQDPAAREARGH